MPFDNNPSMTLAWLDPALRGAVVAMLLMLAAVLWRDQGRSQAGRLGAAFAVGAAASVVCMALGYGARNGWAYLVLLVLASGNPVVLWLLARSLFDDEYRLHWRQGGWWLGVAALGLLNCRLQAGKDGWAFASDAVFTAAIAACALLALKQTLATWRGDLIERRRSLRLLVVLAVGGYTLLNSTLHFILRDSEMRVWLSVADAAGQAVLSALMLWQLLGIAAAGLFQPPTPVPLAVQYDAGGRDLAAAESGKTEAVPDPGLVLALQRLMDDRQAYRQENLSIGSLAHLLGQPEYKLRRCINQGLGYRNFNAFLNRYRLDAAKQALSDPDQADAPILEIALEAGFQSLGPFNRAFKADTGMTPSEFRRAAEIQGANDALAANIQATALPITQNGRYG